MIKRKVAHRLIDQLFEICETFCEKGETQEHFQKAKKEGLLGIQSFIAHMIQEIEKKEANQSPEVSEGKKINIEY
jgi:hypothetical protein